MREIKLPLGNPPLGIKNSAKRSQKAFSISERCPGKREIAGKAWSDRISTI
jgi:hypothetical protein